MDTTDPARARSALGLLSVLFFIEAGVAAVGAGAMQLLLRVASIPLLFDVWFKLEAFVWLGLTAALVYGAYNLTQATRQTEVTWVVRGAAGLLLLLQLYFSAQSFIRADGWSPVDTAASLGISLAMLALSGGLLLIMGRLGNRLRFAAGIGAFALLRAMASAATLLHVVGRAEWTYGVRTLLGLGISIAMGVLALQAKNAVTAGGDVLDAPVAQQPIMEASGMRLIFTGVALLVLGVGVTAISYSAASGGGRYLVATGAIAPGLVQVARGVVRLGKGS